MKTLIKNLVCLSALVALHSCDDIIEKDISDDMVTITYPQNNTTIESNAVSFQWSALDGADSYRIQVYSSNQSIALDSLVTTNNFTYAINPGTYQWRVRGENFAYQTAYTFPASFTLIASEDLTNQQVILQSPSSGIYTQNVTPAFSWSSIAAADSYDFELVNTTSGNIVHQQPDLNSTTYTLPNSVITQDAQYTWKIKAKNNENGTATQFATRNFYIDRTAPNQSVNTLPNNNFTTGINQLINFEWTTPSDNGPVISAVSYTIQIATDENFNTVINTNTSSLSTYQFTFTNTGNYFWRVRAVDQAGNQSAYSTFTKIIVQ